MIMSATGHRPNKLNNEYGMTGPMSTQIQADMELICYLWQVETAISGMALGWDMCWALTSLRLGIPLTCAIPFVGQELKWPPESQKLYREILSKARYVIPVCEPGYAPWKMQRRNEWMVNNSDAIIAGWDGSSGGTFNCYKYAAESVSCEIIRINPKNYKLCHMK